MNPKRKLLVTGAQGFVAGSVLAQAGPEWEVHGISRSEPARPPQRIRWHTCDMLQKERCAELFQAIKPDAVIHTAAVADIDFGESNRELAKQVNVEMTRILASLANESGCRFVFCSTDTVFDGEHAPYHEDDQPVPVNFYARTKVEAEKIVRGLEIQTVIARLSLVVGLPLLGAGNSLLARMLAAFKDSRLVTVPEREVRTPVDVITVGLSLLELAAGNQEGIFHIAGNDRLNRVEIARRIATQFGFDSKLIMPQEPEAMRGRAIRPRDVSLDNAKARAHLKTPMRSFDEGLSLVREVTPQLSI